MGDSINAFGEEIGRNAARATYDLLTLHNRCRFRANPVIDLEAYDQAMD